MNNTLAFQQFLRENKIFTRFNLQRVGLFGSYARDEADAEDIDLLIEEEIDPEQLIQFKIFLEDAFQKRVDIVLKKFANPIILYRAQKDLQYATRN